MLDEYESSKFIKFLSSIMRNFCLQSSCNFSLRVDKNDVTLHMARQFKNLHEQPTLNGP